MRIPLSQGKFTIVDEADYEWLNQWKWSFKDNGTGYAVRRMHLGTFNGIEKGKMIRMHRLIMNTPDDMDTDHINGDGLDNRRCNLRICTTSQNVRNQKKTRGISKYKGVTWHKPCEKWLAQIKVNRKHNYLGLFDSEEDAAIAYNMAALKHHREYAKLNII